MKQVWINGKPDTILTMAETCKYLDCSKAPIYKWIEKEGFPVIIKDGNKATFRLSTINEWIDDKVKKPSTNHKLNARLARLRNNESKTSATPNIDKLAETLKPLVCKDDKISQLEQQILQLKNEVADMNPVLIAEQAAQHLFNTLKEKGLW